MSSRPILAVQLLLLVWAFPGLASNSYVGSSDETLKVQGRLTPVYTPGATGAANASLYFDTTAYTAGYCAIGVGSTCLANKAGDSVVNNLTVNGTCTGCTTATIGGSIAATQVGFGSASNTLAGTSDFIWNDTSKRLSISAGATPSADVHIRKTANAPVFLLAQNDSTGTASQAGYTATNDNGDSLLMRATGTGFTTVGLYTAGMGILASETGLGGLIINTEGPGDPIILGVNDVENMRLDGSSVQVNAGSGGYLGLMGQTAAQELRFYEPSGSGSNYMAFKAQAMVADITFDWPANAGTNGQVLTTNGTTALSWTTVSGGVTDHGALTGLLDDDHTQYALLAGRSGGQTLYGGTASGNDLTLAATSHATRGNIFGNDFAYFNSITTDIAGQHGHTFENYVESATTELKYGIQGGAWISAAGTPANKLVGVQSYTGFITGATGSSTSQFIGFDAQLYAESGQTVPTYIGFEAMQPTCGGCTGAVTKYVGFYAHNATLPSNTHKTGILITDQTGGTLANKNLVIGPTMATNLLAGSTGNFAIYSTSSMVSHFGGGVGIFSATPGSNFAVGALNQFTVNSSGNVTRINDVPYSWPASQGAASTALVNDGTGNLTWTATSGFGVTAHSALTGLTTGDDHTQYVLKNGRSTEQYIYGGTTSGGNLQLEASFHATDGTIFLRSPTQLPFNKFEVLNSDVGDSLFNKYISSGSRTAANGGARFQAVIENDVATLGGNVTGRIMGSYSTTLVASAFDGTASDVVGSYGEVGVSAEASTVTVARGGVFGVYDSCTACTVTSVYGLQVYDTAVANNTRKRGVLITSPSGGSASNIALLIGPDVGEAYTGDYAIYSASTNRTTLNGALWTYYTATETGINWDIFQELKVPNAATGAAWNVGTVAQSNFSPTATATATGDFQGLYAWAGIGGGSVSGTVTGEMTGVFGDMGIDGDATNLITTGIGGQFGAYEGGGGSITNVIGVKIYDGGAITGSVTKYGILIEEATGASTANIDLGIGIATPFSATGSWAIYSESSRNSLLQGGLALGTTSQFAVNSSGNITKINNVTTSWPGSQGAANSILQNNGSGTLTWVATPACANCLLQGGNAFGATLSFGTTDNEKITFKTNNTIKWELLTDGTLQPNTNNTYNLGGTTRRIAEEFFSETGLHLGVGATAEMVLSYTDAVQDTVNFNTDSTGNADFAFFTDLLYLDKSASRVGILTNAPNAALSVGTTNQFTVSSAGLITTASNAAINGGTISTTVTTDFYLLTTGTLGKIHIGDDSTEVNLGSGAAGTGCTMSPAGAYACASYGSFADLFTTETSFDLITTNATSINFGLAATTITVGHDSSGGVTFRNDVTVENNLQVNVALLPDADLGADVGSSTLAMRDTYTGSVNLNSDTTADTGTVSRHVGMTFCDNTGGDASISLPAITTGIGQVVRVVKAQNTNKCTVNRTSTNTITVGGAGTGQTTFDIPTGTGNMSALCQANGVSGSSGIWVCDIL